MAGRQDRWTRQNPRWIPLRLRYSDSCCECDEPLAEGEDAYWHSGTKQIICHPCHVRPKPLVIGPSPREQRDELWRRQSQGATG